MAAHRGHWHQMLPSLWLSDHDPPHLRMRQARLEILVEFPIGVPDVRPALALPQAVVLRVIVRVLAGRQEMHEGVLNQLHRAPSAILAQLAPILASGGDRLERGGVESQARGEIRVGVVGFIADPSPVHRRAVRAIDGADFSPGTQGRHVRLVGRQEPHAEIVFEEGIDSVERSPRPTAGDRDVGVAHDDAQVFRAQPVGLEADPTAPHGRARPDEDVAIGPLGLLDDRKLRPAGQDQMLLKLLGGVHFRGDCIGRHDDVPAVEVGKIDPGGDRRGCAIGDQGRNGEQGCCHCVFSSRL